MKVAWFSGDIREPGWGAEPLSQDAFLALPADHERTPRLRVLLIPDGASLGDLQGDDWNDAPAGCNAGQPYDWTIPEGSVWLDVAPGDAWPL